MKRILTGIQSSGRQHLGNVLGGIEPALQLADKAGNESFFFIADFHSLTTIKDAEVRRANVLATAVTWLACGLNPEKSTFYLQSDIPECAELAWYLSCFTPFPMLVNAHSFKDKSDRLSDVNTGLFNYPVLMAADIILYDAHLVPVGKDQKQHLEITRDIAQAVNRKYDKEIFVVPEPYINAKVMTVPGTDGQKMSKSYNNVIDIFLPEKELKKQVMGIVTDSTPLEEPMNPDNCTVFALYGLLATEDEIAQMRENYLRGGYGYGRAKKALLERIFDKFAAQRERFDQWMAKPDEVRDILAQGAIKGREVARATLHRVRENLGY